MSPQPAVRSDRVRMDRWLEPPAGVLHLDPDAALVDRHPKLDDLATRAVPDAVRQHLADQQAEILEQ